MYRCLLLMYDFLRMCYSVALVCALGVTWVWCDTTEFYSIYKYTWDNFRPTWDALSPNIEHAQANYKN